MRDKDNFVYKINRKFERQRKSYQWNVFLEDALTKLYFFTLQVM